MRDLFSSKCLGIMSYSFQNFSIVLGKVLVPSSAFYQCLENNFGALLTELFKAFAVSHMTY